MAGQAVGEAEYERHGQAAAAAMAPVAVPLGFQVIAALADAAFDAGRPHAEIAQAPREGAARTQPTLVGPADAQVDRLAAHQAHHPVALPADLGRPIVDAPAQDPRRAHEVEIGPPHAVPLDAHATGAA